MRRMDWTLAMESGALLKDYGNVGDRPAARPPPHSNLVFRGWLGGMDVLIRELQPRCSSIWLTEWGQWPIKGPLKLKAWTIYFLLAKQPYLAPHKRKAFTMGEHVWVIRAQNHKLFKFKQTQKVFVELYCLFFSMQLQCIILYFKTSTWHLSI